MRKEKKIILETKGINNDDVKAASEIYIASSGILAYYRNKLNGQDVDKKELKKHKDTIKKLAKEL